MNIPHSIATKRSVQRRFLMSGIAALLVFGTLLPSSQAGPRFGRGGGGFGGHGWGGGRSYGGWHGGARFYSGYSCSVPYRTFNRSCFPGYSSGYYGNYRSYGNYGNCGYGAYSWRYCDPTPFPYYMPRIYVVPQPARYYDGPAYRNVVVLPQPITAVEAMTIPPLPRLAQDPAQALRPESITEESAWGYLDQGKSSMALRAFAHLSATAPESGMHKVGYGLAAALAGDKITANYALRLAFESDPVSADDAPISQELKASLKPLAAGYRQTMVKQPKDLNVRFLYVAVSHFIDDDQAALNSVVDSIALGDLTPSTANLRWLVETQNQVPPAGKQTERASGATLAVYSVEKP